MTTDRKSENHGTRQPAHIYRVYVDGRVPGGWEDRLGCLQVVHEEKAEPSGRITLMGAVRDQAELLGILNTLHQLRLTLLLVESDDVKSDTHDRMTYHRAVDAAVWAMPLMNYKFYRDALAV
jgi:hypothetical protein